MKTKLFTIVALATFTLLLAGRASAVDGHEQAEMAATDKVAAEAEAQMSAEASADGITETMATPETEAKAAEKVAEKGTATKKSDAKFEEKVTAYNKDKEKKEKVVCRREKKTGSHFSRRRCVTASQAKREREDAQDAIQRASRGSNSGPIN